MDEWFVGPSSVCHNFYHFNASIGALVFLRSPLSSLMYIVKKVVALNVLYDENNLNFLM